jgi:hemoglobin
MTNTGSLYERLGGQAAIDAVVDEFYDRVLADERVAHHFAGVDVAALRAHQKRFVAAAAGGPDAYDGRDMAAAHEGLDITAEEFAVVADHLDAALAAKGVSEADREALLSEVAALEPAVVSA